MTEHGEDCLRASAESFEEMRARRVSELGEHRVNALADDLETLAGAAGPARLGDPPGWLH